MFFLWARPARCVAVAAPFVADQSLLASLSISLFVLRSASWTTKKTVAIGDSTNRLTEDLSRQSGTLTRRQTHRNRLKHTLRQFLRRATRNREEKWTCSVKRLREWDEGGIRQTTTARSEDWKEMDVFTIHQVVVVVVAYRSSVVDAGDVTREEV